MILFSFKHKAEILPEWKNAPLREWRWVLFINKFSFGFAEQVLFPESKWGGGLRYYAFNFNKNNWGLGADHFYYDGPHCSFSIGPFSYSWSGDWCTKCHPDN
jgi:hypothetical protein